MEQQNKKKSNRKIWWIVAIAVVVSCCCMPFGGFLLSEMMNLSDEATSSADPTRERRTPTAAVAEATQQPTALPTTQGPPTETSEPLPTEIPTETSIPTETPIPTETLVPTDTPPPTATPTPTPRPQMVSCDEILRARDSMTDLQWDNFKQDVEGTWIENWAGTIRDVDDYSILSGGYPIHIGITSRCDIYYVAPDEETALQYGRGQQVNVTAQVQFISIIFGDVTIYLEDYTMELE